MKITAGIYKGYKIKSNSNIKPTMGKVRESIFNIIRHNQLYFSCLHNGYILDLCCGSGALGIEALSCGAKHVFMIDVNVNAVTANCVPFASNVTIIRASANRLPKSDKWCDVIFIDPPYKKTGNELILSNLVKSRWVKSGSLIFLEVSSQYKSDNFQHYQLMDERKYGSTKVLIMLYMSHKSQVIHQMVLDEFDDAEILLKDTAGDDNHFHLTVTSGYFNGRTLVEQHRMVHAALQGKVGEEIHALQIKTIAKGEENE